MMNDESDSGENKGHAVGVGVGGQSFPTRIISYVNNNRKNAVIWGSFIVCCVVIWFLFSSGDFSFLLTFAALWRCFGLLLMNYKVWKGNSLKGVSIKTMELYATSFVFRLLSILRHQGYLPFDKTGDWFYHVIEFASLASVALVLFGAFGPLKSTYDAKYDKFGNLNVPAEYGVVYLVVPCVVMALMFHPELNKEFFSDVCWTFSMYLEAVAMLPQLYMFQKQASDADGTVEVMLGHVTFALGFSRIFELWFWMGSFKELANINGKVPGYIVLLSQVGQLLIMGDFFYYYFVSISKGMPMELPHSLSSTNV